MGHAPGSMYTPRRDSKPDGWKGGNKFGGGGFKKSFHDRDSGPRPQLFDAVCAECGERCQVPFRPNGRKPVYCSNCFKKDGNDEPRRFGGDDDRRPSFAPRERFGSAPASHNGQMNEQLAALNIKLDKVLTALSHLAANQLTKEEHALDGMDVQEEVVKTKKEKVVKKKKKA